MPPLKILTIVPSYKPAYIYGGPIRSISSLCEALSIAGHHVTVYTTTANGGGELDVDPGAKYVLEGVSVIYFRRLTKGHSNFSPKLILRMIQEAGKFDIVHVHSWWNLISIPIVWICLTKGITPIISPRGTLTTFTFHHKNRIFKRVFHFVIGKRLLNSSALHFTSPRERKEALHFVNGRRTYELSNLLELPKNVLGLHQDTPYLKLIFLGRIDPAKNLEVLLSALSMIIEFRFELVLAGDGNVAYVSQLQHITAGMTSVRWMGHVEGNLKYKLLAEADILILPSHTENFGNVVFESLSQGTAVMISDQVGAKDYILEKNLGWVVTGNKSEWREALTNAWHNKEKRDLIRQQAPKHISTDFNSELLVNRYVNMYFDHIKCSAGR